MVHNVLGATYARLRNYERAIASYITAVRLQPNYAEAYNNLGAAWNEIGRHQEAIESYRNAIKFEPGFFEAYHNLGNALADEGKLDDAIASYGAAIRIKPDFEMASALRAFQLAHICDWDELQACAAEISALGVSTEKVNPWSPLHLEDNPARHRQRSEVYAKKTYEQRVDSLIERPEEKPGRVRIGYFSADFHDHATMYLMAKLFELHDRELFEVYAYSYGINDSGTMRSRVTRGGRQIFRY